MTETPLSPQNSPAVGPRSFVDRLLGALQLDATVFGEVEHDADALPQAAGVVALAAVASGIGGVAGGSGGLIAGVVGAIAGWLIGAGIIWLVGVRIMEHSSNYPELLRTIGFASAPQILMVLAIIPVLGWAVRIVVFFWGLAAYVIAVREALDVETGRAVLVCILAWGVSMALAVVLFGMCAGGTAIAI
ncbi:MAG: YIP1 family protein [Myxococcales bacterium]|nr:YIP1 family protein [Myxococcales bacterium]